MRTKYRKDTKKCPRCGQKCLTNQKDCPSCGLIFKRLEMATNTQAKKQFFKKDKSVVMTNNLPSDVKRWVLILLCLFLGSFGAHCFAVGRYYRGTYMLVVTLISLVVITIQYTHSTEVFMSYFFVFPALMAIFWMVDLFEICFGLFKVPVALES